MGNVTQSGWVRLKDLPEWAYTGTGLAEEVMRFCLGRTYRVIGFREDGWVMLDVSTDVDEQFGGHGSTLHVPIEHLEAVNAES